MKRFIVAASVLALMAGEASAQPGSKPAAKPAAGCSASTTVQWGPKGKSYKVEVLVTGATCEKAVTTLAVYDKSGLPFYAWASPAQYLFALRDATNVTKMKEALADWLSGPQTDTTADLPPWAETEGQPKRAEFPFMPREGMDKEQYEDLKKEKLPMLCFPQGGESMQCLALYGTEDGGQPMADDIGLQLFPG